MHHIHAQLKVHICAPYTHTCTTQHMCTIKYHQNIRYTQLAFLLYSMKHQVQMRDLCWISCFWCFSLFRWKPQCFSQKLPLFMKTATVFIVSFWVITKYTSSVRKTKQTLAIISFEVLVISWSHLHAWTFPTAAPLYGYWLIFYSELVRNSEIAKASFSWITSVQYTLQTVQIKI